MAVTNATSVATETEIGTVSISRQFVLRLVLNGPMGFVRMAHSDEI